MVRKKYDVILDMLKKEQMHYSRQNSHLEGILAGQTKELVVLNKEYSEVFF